jgi:thiamine-monophosphate kinase
LPDETSIIETIVGLAGGTPRGYSKIGDDVAVVRQGAGKLVLKVDMLLEQTDVPTGMTYRQAARKSVAMCVSDFAAKGVKPDSFMVSLGLRRGVTEEQVKQLGLGFCDAEREWGVKLVGGDTNEARELVIDCAMVGFGTRITTRKGGSAGDALVVTGPFGYPPSGLKILAKGAEASAKFAAAAKNSVLKPTPSLGVGLALAPFLTSSMDSSDGLAKSIHTLAKESGVGFELASLPTAEGVEEFAWRNGFDAHSLVLEGGEEYVIVGTVRKSRVGQAREAVEKAGGELIEIGTATSRTGEVALRSGRKLTPIHDAGWTHLSGG